LDFASGCGSASIAAVHRGAKSAIANDICTTAKTAVSINAELSLPDMGQRARLHASTENLIGSMLEGVIDDGDIVFAGDVLYDAEFAGKATCCGF
jgi:predicted nicotinamide N-methyase